MQLATRSYQNLYGFENGTRPDSGEIIDQLLHHNFIIEKDHNKARGLVPCPGGGTYACVEHFPAPGDLFMKCSLATTSEHEPREHSDW